MQAYIILDGGGVKGAALAGCLKALKELDIEPVGYGGTSAGSIIAALAAAGYEPEELEDLVVNQLNFNEFLDDDGKSLQQLEWLASHVRLKWWSIPGDFARLWRNRVVLRKLLGNLGIYHGRKFETFLCKKLDAKLTSLKNMDQLTFSEFEKAGGKPLKVVASNVTGGRAAIYSANQPEETNGLVIQAVRASMSYPFVFEPVKLHRDCMVDGGLSSNLPVFLFEPERSKNRLPIIAFDLVPMKRPPSEEPYGISRFVGDMLNTAIESGDELLRQRVDGLMHVPVQTPSDIGTLDFNLSSEKRKQLFDCGRMATLSYFTQRLHYAEAANPIQQLQSIYGDPAIYRWILEKAAREFRNRKAARRVRASIMLPTYSQTRVVVYQYGMDRDPDCDFAIPLDAGCTGRAFILRKPMTANLEDARTNLAQWKLKQEQQNKIPTDRMSMLAVPILDLDIRGSKKIEDCQTLGTLSVDLDVPFESTGWSDGQIVEEDAQILERWAVVIARLLR